MNDTSPQALQQDRIVADIATMLQIEAAELDLDALLSEQGLDSLRMITLIESWRAAGADIDFHRMMALPTAREWIAELNA
ncbi:phosphopantetheine-binding protein [Corynebacterium pseudopelargi]|uniref:Phenyloxazoline synthase MbtB n=1 Tax=Corynebacterium pseudopelargi TaxID=2080757 RepID=A0A3G6J0X4_9CORY|nr:phosphopantetheine-binding protein [Corynebacterium pseudopelargi]AZA10020.1 Phenyloxazoline synthase MbtB [Corynebacterium pseudopelargi]